MFWRFASIGLLIERRSFASDRCTPEDAYRCFMRTEMDYLVLGSCLLDKKQQPKLADQQDWRKDFGLD